MLAVPPEGGPMCWFPDSDHVPEAPGFSLCPYLLSFSKERKRETREMASHLRVLIALAEFCSQHPPPTSNPHVPCSSLLPPSADLGHPMPFSSLSAQSHTGAHTHTGRGTYT